LGIGLADALVTRLSNVRRLIVRPTSSVLPFGDSQTNPFQAGRELGVNFVLDGNIRRVGERIRVTVQLLNVGENSSSRAESFNEHFTDVLELEDLISEKVVKSLIPRLPGEEQQKLARRGTNSPEAYEAYMRGRYRWNQFTPDALSKAREAFQSAIELDPNYALAHVGLADFYIWANIYGMIPSGEAVSLAQTAANRAIELDAKLGEAYASLGLTFQNRFSWAKAEQLYKQALELAPNYTHAHEWWAAQLVGHGNFEEGAKEIKITERLDPLSLRTKTLTAWTLYQAQRFDEALERARQIIDLDLNYPQGYSQIGLNLLAMGQAQKALPHLQKFDAMIPNSALAKYQLCFAFVAAGRRDEAKRVLGEIKQLAAGGYVKPYFLAMAHAALDERDSAFANFERAVDENEPWMLWFGTEPMLENLHDDERFDRILRRMNNPLAKRKETKTEQSSTNSEKSIAVLPLQLIGTTGALNDTGGDNYLPIGLADALITRLSNVRRFVVRPTSSVLPYREKQTDAFVAGKELAVDFVVDGTIRRVGKRIRVTAQLLSVVDSSTRWAQSFDEDFSDVLALEDSISEQVAKSLLPHLTGEEEKQIKKRGTDNVEAFEAYLRGRFYWNTFTEEGFAKALIFYNQAIAIAPDYALAYAGIADYYNLLGIYAVMPFQETSAAAKEAAQRAIEADDNLAEGYAALGFAVLMHDFDWAEAEKNLRRAVQINPNYVTGRVWYSYFLGLKGEWSEALAQVRRALELDPLTPVVSHTLNMTLYYA
ncbi:MAG: tetratricopeptide repeat protein, partial [Acidobacteriota bacterium]|nr:tetratricopeptide repeat protein [Acidobacteriota bacterium]